MCAAYSGSAEHSAATSARKSLSELIDFSTTREKRVKWLTCFLHGQLSLPAWDLALLSGLWIWDYRLGQLIVSFLDTCLSSFWVVYPFAFVHDCTLLLFYGEVWAVNISFRYHIVCFWVAISEGVFVPWTLVYTNLVADLPTLQAPLTKRFSWPFFLKHLNMESRIPRRHFSLFTKFFHGVFKFPTTCHPRVYKIIITINTNIIMYICLFSFQQFDHRVWVCYHE